jgi:hypothetical protein
LRNGRYRDGVNGRLGQHAGQSDSSGWPVFLRFVRRLPMSAGREACAGACGQALNKPEGRKPRGAPMQGELSGYGD